MTENWMEVLRVAGARAGDRVMFAFSFGPFLGFWLAFEAAVRLGCLCFPAGGLSSLARLRLMRDNQTRVLCCTPTYALHLAEVAATERIDIAALGVQTLVVAGEPGGSIPATRAKLESLWPKARVCDHHGMTEVGPVTFECPRQPGVLHVMESSFLAEIIDPATGAAAAAGELVLTTLTRTGSPLLRYRTGDLVKRDAGPVRCVCGRSELRLAGGIIGRSDDMVIVRGVNIFPAAVEEVLRRFEDLAEYRVRICQAAALTEIKLEVEPRDQCPDVRGLVTSIRQTLEAVFGLRIPVEAVAPGSLPRFEMKARRWRRDPV
jgi:phenylacetate-CoA ligase